MQQHAGRLQGREYWSRRWKERRPEARIGKPSQRCKVLPSEQEVTGAGCGGRATAMHSSLTSLALHCHQGRGSLGKRC